MSDNKFTECAFSATGTRVVELERERDEAREEALKLLNMLLSANIVERDYELPWEEE